MSTFPKSTTRRVGKIEKPKPGNSTPIKPLQTSTKPVSTKSINIEFELEDAPSSEKSTIISIHKRSDGNAFSAPRLS